MYLVAFLLIPLSLATAVPAPGAPPSPDSSCSQPNIVNPGFETGSLSPWTIPSGSVPGTVIKPGSKAGGGNSQYSIVSGLLQDGSRFAIDQAISFCYGVNYTCSFDWRFEAFYSVSSSGGGTTVPHVTVNIYANPSSTAANVELQRGQQGHWLRSTFSYKTYQPGTVRLEFFAQSPQPQGTGSNHVRFDNLQCRPQT